MHRTFDLVGLAWSWRVCISEKFSGEADAGGLWTTLLEALENQCCRDRGTLEC